MVNKQPPRGGCREIEQVLHLYSCCKFHTRPVPFVLFFSKPPYSPVFLCSPAIMLPSFSPWEHSPPPPSNHISHHGSPQPDHKDHLQQQAQPKKPRHRHSAFQLAALNQLYDKNEHPSLEERTALAERLGMCVSALFALLTLSALLLVVACIAINCAH